MGLASLFLALGATADVVLLYTPKGHFFDDTYAYLKHISAARLMMGSALGIIAIPFTILGVRALEIMVNKAEIKRIKNIILGFIGVGVLVHFLFGLTGLSYHLKSLEPFQIISIWLLRSCSVLLLVLHVWMNILLYRLTQKHQNMPSFLQYINPFSIYLGIVLFYVLYPVSITRMLVVAGLNLAYLTYFLLLFGGIKAVDQT